MEEQLQKKLELIVSQFDALVEENQTHTTRLKEIEQEQLRLQGDYRTVKELLDAKSAPYDVGKSKTAQTLDPLATKKGKHNDG